MAVLVGAFTQHLRFILCLADITWFHLNSRYVLRGRKKEADVTHNLENPVPGNRFVMGVFLLLGQIKDVTHLSVDGQVGSRITLIEELVFLPFSGTGMILPSGLQKPQ